MFELNSVTKKFTHMQGCTTILDSVSYRFDKGCSYAIMGPSGVGKSTLLYLLAGFEPCTRGHITYGGKNISGMAQKSISEYERFLQTSLGLVFQAPCLVPELSSIENVSLKGLISGMPFKECRERAKKLLQRVGLADVVEQPITTLSGGQQQRVALARALFLSPDFLLLDEPTAHVDAATAQDIIMLLQEFQKTDGLGIIVVCHDIVLAQAMDYILTIKDGKLSACQKN
jgi:ABC-type lipoprotein export system ATPase subunit